MKSDGVVYPRRVHRYVAGMAALIGVLASMVTVVTLFVGFLHPDGHLFNR